MADKARSRDWSSKDRMAYWLKLVALVGTCFGAAKGVDEGVAVYARQAGLQTQEQAAAEHEAIEGRVTQGLDRLEAKLDRVIMRLDAVASRRDGK